MKAFSEILSQVPEYQSIVSAFENGGLPACMIGLSHIHKSHVIYALCTQQLETGALVLTHDEAAAARIADDINTFAAEQLALLYPARDYNFRDVDSGSREYEQLRLSVLHTICADPGKIVVCSVEAAIQYTMPKGELLKRTFTLRQGDSMKPEDLVQKLSQAGYVSRPQIEGVSQYSLRGGIIDFFPPGSPYPVRAEFWGDEIDTLSYFDVESQRRTDRVEAVEITPAGEILFDSPQELAEKLRAKMKSVRTKNAAVVRENMQRDIDRLESGLAVGSIDRYLGLCYEKPETLFDYMADQPLIISEYTSVKESARALNWQMNEDIKMLLEDGLLTRGLDSFLLAEEELDEQIRRSRPLLLETFTRTIDLPLRTVVNLQAVQLSYWSGQLSTLLEDLESLVERQYTVFILAGTDKTARSLAYDLQRKNYAADYVQELNQILPGRVYVMEGYLSAGLEYPLAKIAIITHGKTQAASQRKKKKKKGLGERISSLSDLTPGDYVVHAAHGIGIFDGIHKIDLHGVVKDYIKIRYAASDVLYVPVTQLDMVSKYIGPKEDSAIRLNRLNSTDWQKTKTRVKKAVADMADELIKIYAARMQAPGFAFSPDTDWQNDFEDRFPYEETEDQLRCVKEIKHDMERPSPMDRLLCGDVGFGKTEVALRAAFKAVMDSKQVAILVPTTILAWQHYQTITKRMEGFPIQVELLSRFRSPKYQEQVIRKLKTGEVDIVIGTHRLIQKDVTFKNLGLAIVDEEQRFGVAHKEKFKAMYPDIDMLTLSATPIPRTLNMAMSGIRDMSVIEEAPGDRYPVQTYVTEHDYRILAEAIRKELRRGGQVYYIHNRIETIDQRAGTLSRLVPDARIVTAHGKMGEEQLSEVWRQLIDHEIDILVCTTIIETGVDVPNCNTMIIEDADYFGLSQLYQLRGRIGRSNRRAFAYFTFRPGKTLTEVATKRLEAIREFTKFGSGFRIALRDLEIRGAGNILGSRQHGHMEAVGYDMYVKLLTEAIAERKGEPPKKKTEECLIDVAMEAHIPESYIGELSQRIDVYKKIAAIQSEEDTMDVVDELIDRFGEPPQSVYGLVEVARLRGTASSLGFQEINERNGSLLFVPEKLDMELAVKTASALKPRVLVNAGSKPYLAVKILPRESPLDTMRLVLETMANINGSQPDAPPKA